MIITALTVLIIGSYTDLKTREVPDWVNFGLIITGLGIRALYSSARWDASYLLGGITGLAIMIIAGYAMYYTGQWGGGDSKMLMGLGALFGAKWGLIWNQTLLIFLINSLLIGAVYGLAWSAGLAIMNWKRFYQELIRAIHEKKMLKTRKRVLITMISLITMLSIALAKGIIGMTQFLIMMTIIAVLYSSFALLIFVKVVENTAMYKYVKPSALTEGDWIAEEVKHKGKVITGPKDLGISRYQIQELKDLGIKKIKIKNGIPFVPSFLLAYIMTLWLGAWWIKLI